MDTCSYTKVDTDTLDNSDVNNEKPIKLSWKPLLRQVMVCYGMWTMYFVNGMIMGAPTVVIPQMRKEANSTDAVSESMSSWLMSITGLSGLLFVGIYPVMMHYFGRKIAAIAVFSQMFVGFVVFYFSNTALQLLMSFIILSVNVASSLTISPVMVSEYTSPRYRGMFLTIKSASTYWGLWVSNAIGTYYHWKVIGISSLVLISYSLTIVFWPESPYWLASKGRFKECAKSHRWLKGKDKESKEELEKLIESQKCYFSNSDGEETNVLSTRITMFWNTLTSKEIYRPLLISILLFLHYFLSGKIVCSLYILEIIKKLSDNESTAYKTMLILDGVTVLGMYTGCVLAKYFRRRTLMMTSSVITGVLLFLISIYLFLIWFSVIAENALISISLLTIFSLGVSCGPLILSTSLYAEMMPLRFKSSATCLIAIFTDIMFFITVKVAPSMFSAIGLHGSFLFYGIGFTICSLLLYKYLPETKDKTLQEIEEYFKQ